MHNSARTFIAACILSAPAQSQEQPKAPASQKTCSAEFLTDRRTEANWYPDHDFSPKVACPKTGPHQIDPTKSITIYWATISNDWTRAAAQEKVEAAKKWFKHYCVTLSDQYVDLTKSKTTYKRFVDALAVANAQGRSEYQDAINNAFARTWREAKSPSNPFLIVLFVDPYKEVEFSQGRISDVSANYADIALILITAKDKGKEHIFTHEVLHGLGKVLDPTVATSASTKPMAPAPSKPYFGGVADAKSTWDDADCLADMGNSKDLSAAKNDAPIDWAAYWEYVKVAKTLK